MLFSRKAHAPIRTLVGDSTVLRLKHPATGADTGRGLAVTADGNHRW